MVAVCVTAFLGLSGCDAIMGLLNTGKAARQWEGDIKEIAFSELNKDGKVFTIELHSRIDAPADKIWESMKNPGRLAETSEQYKKSEVLVDEGNRKEVEVHMLALGNLQMLKLEMIYDDATKVMHLKTLESAMVDIDATYSLEPSPDGSKTMYVYKAKQTDKIQLPIGTGVQESAIKESFVNQVRAIKSQLGAG